MDDSKQTHHFWEWLFPSNKKPQREHISRKDSHDRSIDFWSKLAYVVFIIVMFTTILSSFLGGPQSNLDIIASLIPQDNERWNLRGRVLLNGTPVREALIWVMLKDAKGNRDSPSTAISGADGSFIIEAVPKVVAGNPVTEATVYGRSDHSGSSSSWFRKTARGEEVLIIGHGSLRRVKSSVWWLLIPPGIFLISLGVAFGGRGTSWAYGFSILFAFLLTAITIAELSSGLSYVHTTGDRNEILSLGYASVFRGQYVKDIQPEWLFSLTAPHEPSLIESSNDLAARAKAQLADTSAESDKESRTVRGFGAPLWVLLLAVVGVGLRTLLIIVNEISHLPDFSKPEEVRSRIEVLVRHQLFMLFAPLGAIFVYQFLVIAEAATQTAAVALVSLGAGLTLTTLIERALAQTDMVVQQTAITRGDLMTQKTLVTGIGTDTQQMALAGETAKIEETVVTKPTTDRGHYLFLTPEDSALI